MVEMDLKDRSREPAWHDWYASHIHKLLTIEGFSGSQRFQSLVPTPSPFLAIHDVSGPELFESAAYLAIGGPDGTGIWRDLMTNWYRNVFDGLEYLPEVGDDEKLVVIDDGYDVPQGRQADVAWLSIAGLDRTAQHRGLLVLEAGDDVSLFNSQDGVRVFRPISRKFR